MVTCEPGNLPVFSSDGSCIFADATRSSVLFFPARRVLTKTCLQEPCIHTLSEQLASFVAPVPSAHTPSSAHLPSLTYTYT